MQFTYHNRLILNPLNYFYEERTFEIPKILGVKNYALPFNLLKNLDLVKTFTIKRYKLTAYYIYLLEQE